MILEIIQWSDYDFKKMRAVRMRYGSRRGRYVITCFRQKYYAERYLPKEEYADMEDRIEISLVKVNNGELDTMEAMFVGEYFDVIPIEQQGVDLDSQDDAFTN